MQAAPPETAPALPQLRASAPRSLLCVCFWRRTLWRGRFSSTLMSSAALATYRQLLRVRSQAFRGDTRALTAAQQEIRSKYEEVRAWAASALRRFALSHRRSHSRATSATRRALRRCCKTLATPRSSSTTLWCRVRRRSARCAAGLAA